MAASPRRPPPSITRPRAPLPPAFACAPQPDDDVPTVTQPAKTRASDEAIDVDVIDVELGEVSLVREPMPTVAGAGGVPSARRTSAWRIVGLAALGPICAIATMSIVTAVLARTHPPARPNPTNSAAIAR